MLLKQLTVTDLRNIEAAQFVPSPELTVLCGKNGQGKTNLLEGVWLLTGSKSFRGAKDTELIREGKEFAVIEGVALGFEKESEIRIAVGSEATGRKGRSAKVNGVEYGRATNLAGIFTAVVFDPGHLSLVKGSPEGRRRFLDAALCQLYPQYLAVYRRYTRLVTQKNALLKAYHATRNAAALLDVFDADLARCGAQVSCKRQAYLGCILPQIVTIYDEITSGAETLDIRYQASYTKGEEVCAEFCVTQEEAAQALAQRLQESRSRDIAAGFCTTGPHREDFTLFINGRDAKTYGSQGQQRSAVLALKLAEAAGAQTITGEHPVMLLDDVLSELDDLRQAYLLHRIAGHQTIVTACNPALFAGTSGKVYHMQQGMLQEG